MTDATGEKPFDTQPDSTQLSDPQLLARYVSGRDPAAFEALVRRHGPMVMGVCRRVLRDANDAEDAFQATFLVLIRKAHAIAKPELLANWLYGVACHKSLKARTSAGRRRVHERQMDEAFAAPARDPNVDRDLWLDLQPLLDEELSNLPDKYRAPVVLCDLEGKTIQDAAALLDCPQGTLASRLTKARTMLAQQLTRRGLILSTATISVLLVENAASASVPETTVQAMLNVAAATPAPRSWHPPLPSWLAFLQPAWAAATTGRAKIVTSVVLALGLGTLSIAGLSQMRQGILPFDLLGKPLHPKGQHEPPRDQRLDDGFIVVAGKYSLFNGELTLNVVEDPDSGMMRWTAKYPQRPFGNKVGRSIESGPAVSEMKIGSSWFLYAASADEIWAFSGDSTMMLFQRLHSTQVPPAVPPADFPDRTGLDDTRITSSQLPNWTEILKCAKPPEKVLRRLPPALRPQFDSQRVAPPSTAEGFITSPGIYTLFKGEVEFEVRQDQGLLYWTWTRKNNVSKSSGNASVNNSSWFFFPESVDVYWRFDGRSSIWRYPSTFGPVGGGPFNFGEVPAPGNSPIAVSNERELQKQKAPEPVLRWLKQLPVAQAAPPRNPWQMEAKPGQFPLLPDGCIVSKGDYTFNGTAVKVWEKEGKIHWSVSYPPQARKTGTWSSTTLRSDLPWKLYLESPHRIWSFDGWKTVGRSTLAVGKPTETVQDGKPVVSVASTSVSTPFLTLPAGKNDLLSWGAPAPVQRWISLAKAGDPPSPPAKSDDLPYLPLNPPLRDGFIVAEGEYQLSDKSITLKVWEKQGKVRWRAFRASRRNRNGDIETSEFSVDQTFENGSAWFLFPESADILWTFDGARKLVLIKTTSQKLSESESTKTDTVEADLPTWDSKEYGDLPEKVLQRLPPALRPRHR